jgi:DNA-binding NtrC family response regulator
VSEAFLEQLNGYSWPGNVRELMNVLERVLVNYQVEVLEPEDVADLTCEPGPSRPEAAAQALREIEDEEVRLRTVLSETGGNVSRAARRLGIPRGTLRYRIEKFSLQDFIPKD